MTAQAGGQQHCHGGGAVQQGGDAMGGEEVGAEEGEGGEVGSTGRAGQAAELLLTGEHSGNIKQGDSKFCKKCLNSHV